MSVKPLTAIIVDDEPLALEGLKLRLEKIPEITVVGQASDGDEAIRLTQQLCPDVMFLDLRLPGLNGIEVVQALQSDTMPMIVFVSAYGEYALDAFELNAIDYVLKPANLGRLQKTVERILQRITPKDANREKFKLLKALSDTSGVETEILEHWLASDQPFPTPYDKELVIRNSDNEKVFLPTKDIRWIDAAGDYMCVHTADETFVVRVTMKKLVEQLDPKVFSRIHKSTLVNIHCIKSIRPMRNSECMLDLGNSVQLKVSRNFSDEIQKLVASKAI